MSTTPQIESAMRSLLSQPLMMEPRAALSAISRAAVKMSLSSAMPTAQGVPIKSHLLSRVGQCLTMSIRGPVMNDEIEAWWMGGVYTRAIVAACHEAMNDAAQDVILDIDSPGGSVSGSDDVTEAIRLLASTKRVHAFAHDIACSAAFMYAAPATKILATRSAMVGSIGTIWQILDVSKMLADMGIKYTSSKSGEFKDYGSPTQPTTPDVMAYFQPLTDSMGNDFHELVAECRGIEVADVKAMQARVFVPRDALRANLIDAIVPFDAYVKLVSGGKWEETGAIEMCADDLPEADKNEQGIIPDDSSEPDAAARAGSHTPAALESTMSDKDKQGPGVPVPKIETVAQLRAAHPDLCGTIENEAKASAKEPPASIAQLKAIAPGAECAEFRETCLEASMTESQATAAYAKKLRAENDTLRANASAAKLTPGQQALADQSAGRADPLKLPGASADGGSFMGLVKSNQAKGMTQGKAIEAAAKANPTAHAEWVADGCKGLAAA